MTSATFAVKSSLLIPGRLLECVRHEDHDGNYRRADDSGAEGYPADAGYGAAGAF